MPHEDNPDDSPVQNPEKSKQQSGLQPRNNTHEMTTYIDNNPNDDSLEDSPYDNPDGNAK
jgi:hypothetical protein